MRFASKMQRVILLGVACASLGGLGVWAAEKGEEQDGKAMALEQVSAPVRTAIEKQTKGAKDIKVSSEADDGVTVFEAEFDVNGVKKSVEVSDDGAVLVSESVVSGAEIPRDVTAKLLAEHPKAEIKEVEEVVSTYYEVTYVNGGKEHEIKVYANGNEVEEED